VISGFVPARAGKYRLYWGTMKFDRKFMGFVMCMKRVEHHSETIDLSDIEKVVILPCFIDPNVAGKYLLATSFATTPLLHLLNYTF